MAKKQPPKRKSAPKRKKGSAKSTSSKKNKATPARIEPLYGDVWEKYINGYSGWIAAGLMVLLLLIVFGDYLFGPYLYLFKDIGSDTINIVYPSMAQRSDLIREAGFSSWSFRQGMGQSMYPLGMSDPFFWIYSVAGKENIPFLMAWIGGFQLVLAGVFFFQYLKVLGRGQYVSLFGAVIYAFSGYLLGVHSWQSFNMLFIAGALLLWGTELLLKKNNWLVFPIGIYLIAGPRLVTFGFFLFVYSFFRYIDENGWNLKGLLIFWLKMAGLGALGIMMASWFFGIRFTNLLESSRISGPASRTDSLLQTSIFGLDKAIVNVSSLMRLFSNEMMGSGSDFKGYRNYLESPFYYVGLASLLLIPQAFFHLSKRQKILYGGVLTFWLLLCIFPFFRYGYFLFVTDQFRSFSLHVSYILLFFALFSLWKIIENRKVNLLTLGISLVVLLILLNYPWGDIVTAPGGKKFELNSGLQLAANIFLVVNAILIALLANARFRVIAQGLLLLFVVAELAYFGYTGTHDRDPLTKAEFKAGKGYNDNTHEALAVIREEDQGFFRIKKDFTSSPAIHYGLNDAAIQGFFSTSSYQSHNQKNYLRYLREMGVMEGTDVARTKWIQGFGGRLMLNNMASIKYIMRRKDYRKNYDFSGKDLVNQGFQLFKEAANGDIRIFKNDYFVPFGFTYDSYISYEKFLKMKRDKKDILLMKGAVVFENELAEVSNLKQLKPQEIQQQGFTFASLEADVNARKKGAFQMTDFKHDYLKGTVSLEKEKLVFFSIPFDAGWSAKVDGEEVDLLQVNVGFMGIVVPTGEHTIELSHTPPGLTLLWILTFFGICLYLGLIFYQRRQKT